MFINETGMTIQQLVMVAWVGLIAGVALTDYIIRLIKGVVK